MTPEDILAILKPIAATETMMPMGTGFILLGNQVIDTVNECAAVLVSGGPANYAKFAGEVVRRGWRGTLQQVFGSGAPASCTVNLDLYESDVGATSAAESNDFPEELRELSPCTLDSGAVARCYKGINQSQGTLALTWSRGKVVMTVSEFDHPDHLSIDRIRPIAEALDANYAKHPVP